MSGEASSRAAFVLAGGCSFGAIQVGMLRERRSRAERIGDRVEIAVVRPLCPLDVSPYDSRGPAS